MADVVGGTPVLPTQEGAPQPCYVSQAGLQPDWLRQVQRPPPASMGSPSAKLAQLQGNDQVLSSAQVPFSAQLPGAGRVAPSKLPQGRREPHEGA